MAAEGFEDFFRCTLHGENVSVDTFMKSFPIPEVCLYHSNCPDGIGAMWVVENYMEEANYLVTKGVNHNEPIPWDLIKGKLVVITDFSYSSDITKEICKLAREVLVLDHHESSRRYLEDVKEKNFSCLLDMKRSGAQITWDVFYPEDPRPWFIDTIGDKDLWKWELPNTEEYTSALLKIGYSFDVLEELYNLSPEETEKRKNSLLLRGREIMEVAKLEIEESVRKAKLCKFLGYTVALSTCKSPDNRSKTGHVLCEKFKCDFSVTWNHLRRKDIIVLSARALDESSVNLDDILKQLGGGGHPKAAGLTIHGRNSEKWRNASPEEKKGLAYGTLSKYFIPLKR